MAATTFLFPSAAKLMGLEQDLLPTLTRDNPAFSILPTTSVDYPMVMWEQYDNFLGLQQPRGYNGKPNLVKAVGSKWKQYQPGVYGEYSTIDEYEMTVAREFATFNQPIDVTNRVIMRGNQLLHRQIKREVWLIWQLLANGYFLSTDSYGNLIHADSYTQRLFTATVPWATVATATPLADFRAVRPYARGYSVSFGSQSTAYANNTTVRYALNNQNSADIAGKRRDIGSTVNSLDDLNKILVANDCPRLVEWDGVWQDDSGNNNLDIPDNVVIVKGVRLDGGPVGQFMHTRNANNPGVAPGPYYDVFQNPYAKPSNVEVHRGVNGGPALFFPSAIVIMKV